MSSRINRFSISLFLVLLLAFLVRVINLNYNSPFLDEAIYIVIGKEVLKGNFSEVAGSISWVGGFPFFYPTLSAISFVFGGILGTRFFNVILGTLVVFLTYLFTKQIFPLKEEKSRKTAGLVAAALMATSAIPIAFSRLANYEMLCMAIFLVGLIFLAKAIFEGERNWYLVSAIILFLSFLVKYVVVIFFPVLLLLTFWLARITKKKEIKTGVLKDFCLPLIFLTLLYIGWNFMSLKEFLFNQAIPDRSSALEIAKTFWEYNSIYYLLSLPAIIYLFLKKKVFISWEVIFLVSVSLIPLVAHLLTGNGRSIHQHSMFSLIFILPLIGVFFLEVIQRYKEIGILATILVIFYSLFISIPKVNALGSFWPNTDKANQFFKVNVVASDRILAEGADIVTLALYDKLPLENTSGPFVFSYQDKEGTPAYLKAIGDGYFKFIELDGTNFEPEVLLEIKKASEEKYSLVFDDGGVQIYQLKS